MPMEKGNSEDLDFLRLNAEECIRIGLPMSGHLTSEASIRNYIRIADEISNDLGRGDMLDWGCGYGQMTYLLDYRGFSCQAFDIEKDGMVWPDTPLCNAVKRLITTSKTTLPFGQETFDAVLSCGVLEHVNEEGGDEKGSLMEVNRILKAGGRFFIYQLPQKHAWQENLTRFLKLRKYYHPRRYLKREIISLLDTAGFNVLRVRRANFIPRNLSDIPETLRRFYNTFGVVLEAMDQVACRIPVVNSFAGSLEVLAQKR